MTMISYLCLLDLSVDHQSHAFLTNRNVDVKAKIKTKSVTQKDVSSWSIHFRATPTRDERRIDQNKDDTTSNENETQWKPTTLVCLVGHSQVDGRLTVDYLERVGLHDAGDTSSSADGEIARRLARSLSSSSSFPSSQSQLLLLFFLLTDGLKTKTK